MYIIEVMKDIKWKLRELSHQKYYRYSEAQFTKELEKWYAKNLDQELDLDNPRTFNEKIQWLKLFDSTPEKACLADKLRCRQWVEYKYYCKT